MQTNSHTPVQESKPQRVHHATDQPPPKRPRQHTNTDTNTNIEPSEHLIARAVDLLMEDDSLLCELLLLLCTKQPRLACPAFTHFAETTNIEPSEHLIARAVDLLMEDTYTIYFC